MVCVSYLMLMFCMWVEGCFDMVNVMSRSDVKMLELWFYWYWNIGLVCL